MDSHSNYNSKNIEGTIYNDNEYDNNNNHNTTNIGNVDLSSDVLNECVPSTTTTIVSNIISNDPTSTINNDISPTRSMLTTPSIDVQYPQPYDNSSHNYNYVIEPITTNHTNPYSMNGSYMYRDDNYYQSNESYFNGSYNGFYHHNTNLMHGMSTSPTHSSYVTQPSNTNISGNTMYYNGASSYGPNSLNTQPNGIHRSNHQQHHIQNTANTYVNNMDTNSYANNYNNYEQFATHHQPQQLNSHRALSTHMNGGMSPTARPVANSSHYNMNRYQPTNNGINNNINNNNNGITHEMISVVNTTTMTAFANENVCKQINSILTGQTKDHQAIVLATKGSLSKNMHDRPGLYNDGELSWIDKNMSRKVDVEETVDEILKATGFDNGSNHRNCCTHHGFSYNNDINGHMYVHKSMSNQFLADDADTFKHRDNTTHQNNMDSQSARTSCGNNPNSFVFDNNYNTSCVRTQAGSQSINSFRNLNQFQSTEEQSAIDLSISSDEDMKNMEYGPIGSNPRKFHHYQQTNYCMSPPNLNTPTIIRRKSRNVTGIQDINKTPNATNVKSTVEQNHFSVRTRSIEGNTETSSNTDNMQNAINGFSEMNINADHQNIHMFPGNAVNNQSDYMFHLTNQKNTDNALCAHNIFKEFCSNCISNIPSVPHESVITRMSSTMANALPPKVFTLKSSPRHSSCEFTQPSVNPNNQRNFHTNSTRSNSINSTISSKPVNTHRRDMYSRKVFVGGLPQDITESQIAAEFKRFGELVVDWPHKLDSNSGLPPKGYAFLLFEQAESVVNIIQHCTRIEDKYFWAVSSQRSESKQVQIRPWTITDSVWSENGTFEKPTPRCKRTVFVGGIPRQAQARELFDNMNHCFGCVDLVEIDVDLEYSYPKGAASVTFANDDCYIKALEAHFITLKLCGMEKRVEIKPFFSDDQNCEECGILMNSRTIQSNNNNHQNGSSIQTIGQCFCIARDCLKYFCENCWLQHQIHKGHCQPQHTNKSGGGYHRQFQFRRTNANNNTGSNNNGNYINRSAIN